MPGIGHNNGPSMDRGARYRRYVWTKARADLLPVLPLPVVRLRVKRAEELGLDYRTYATVRATTGRDVVALLFSTNALRLFAKRQALPEDRHQRLKDVTRCERRALAVAPLRAGDVHSTVLDAVANAPDIHAAWTEARAVLREVSAPHPGDAVLMIGDTSIERDWSTAGMLAGYLTADRYFGPTRAEPRA